MDHLKVAVGALVIMTASGMIADFDVSVFEEKIYVTVWSADEESDAKLRRHVAARLPSVIGEARVFVNRDGVISV
jgi:hypothetical protein